MTVNDGEHEPGGGYGSAGGPVFADGEAGDEGELRVLLERGVPQLGAPAQRMEQVRARVRRRRRRRNAGLSATAVLAVAAAGLLLPGVGGPSGAPVPPAVTSLAPPASSTSGPTATRPVYPRHDFPALAGLTLALPPGWSALDLPDGGFVSSQALSSSASVCATPLDGFCTPLARNLDAGGVLVQLTLTHNPSTAAKFRALPREVGAADLGKSCVLVGGTLQLSTLLVDTFPGPPADPTLTPPDPTTGATLAPTP